MELRQQSRKSSSKEQLLLEQHILRYAEERGIYFEQWEATDAPIEHEIGFLCSPLYIKQIFGLKDDELAVDEETIKKKLNQSNHQTCLAKDVNTGTISGFIIFGSFTFLEDEQLYPKWLKKSIPPIEFLLEISLLGGKKGIGRILLALVLASHNNHGHYKGVVLEVLGGAANTRAVSLYHDFGFRQQTCYSSQGGQIRNEFGDIVMYMMLIPKIGSVFCSLPTLQQELQLQRTHQFHSRNGRKRNEQKERNQQEQKQQSQKPEQDQVEPRQRKNQPQDQIHEQEHKLRQNQQERSHQANNEDVENLIELFNLGFILKEEYLKRMNESLQTV